MCSITTFTDIFVALITTNFSVTKVNKHPMGGEAQLASAADFDFNVG